MRWHSPTRAACRDIRWQQLYPSACTTDLFTCTILAIDYLIGGPLGSYFRRARRSLFISRSDYSLMTCKRAKFNLCLVGIPN